MKHLLPLALLLACACATAGCGGATLGTPAAASNGTAFRGSPLNPPLAAPRFALHDQDGHLVDLRAQRGRIVLVTFLYTHCPDVCPLIAENLNQALRQLGPARKQVRVIAVSVDPKGDTVAAVRSYARIHRLLPQFHYLIGTRAELDPVWRAWHIAAVEKSPDLVDHTAYTALIDRSGRERATYDAHIHARDVVHDVRLLLGKGHDSA